MAGMDRTSTYVQVMDGRDDDEWKQRALCNYHGAWFIFCSSSDYRTEAARQRRQSALDTCAQCPVQHRCIEFAIDTMDLWNICASTPDQREAFEKRPSWRDELYMAASVNMPVMDLLANLEIATT